jgi:hypothetical protein
MPDRKPEPWESGRQDVIIFAAGFSSFHHGGRASNGA